MTVCHAGMCLFLSLKSLNLMVRLTEFIQNIMMTFKVLSDRNNNEHTLFQKPQLKRTENLFLKSKHQVLEVWDDVLEL
uniref:Uncharacterized protein n=1 Tax=Anguilla anguilla TaxID=7936 RepID=A0A0E9V2L6_ANGAN